ncbi:cupin domain-containing protein [Variovorax paradoxus]|uniref:Cupin domain-containing protein n=1 Tax=Variovorax paradoxus TaxID=34073 RepID=A0A5Q0M8J6_VARPD|nr:cupin domain-containing protein [Variovorax paradoxus]QFZ85167.1 cupin domain-containing protein [Variovorax paradoxus]
MNIRRVVTGHSDAGKSVVVSDGPPPRSVDFKHVPGMSASLMWETTTGQQVGASAVDGTPSSSWMPGVGGTNLMMLVFPPDSVMADPSFDAFAAGMEYVQNLPGLAEKFERDSPGMHTTDTVDYAVVLDGEICLELDDGQVVSLKKHDVVVQNGTRHAWRNRSDRPVTMLFVLTGAVRSR